MRAALKEKATEEGDLRCRQNIGQKNERNKKRRFKTEVQQTN